MTEEGTNIHITMMQRCLQLAKQGLGTTYPNPLVGSVIVYKGRIIGEGWHKKAGESHAEIVAINSVQDSVCLKESTLYVNLEPCSHFGRTPPCSHKIVEMGIPKVVVGCRDLASHVNGQGIAYLRNHGVKVIEGVLEQESQWVNRRFLNFHLKRRPYIILKFAQTSNGYFAPADGQQKWITGRYSKQMVHKWRTEEMAILVGKKTAQIDKPALTARLWSGHQPKRLLISKEIDVSVNPFISSEEDTMVFNAKMNKKENHVTFIKLDFDQNVVKQILSNLYDRNIQSIIVEGGAETINYFLELDLWDETRVLEGNVAWQDGIIAPKLENAILANREKIGEDIYYQYKPTKS